MPRSESGPWWAPAVWLRALGGDEFVVLLADAPDLASALAVAEAIRDAVAQPITFDDRALAVTVSIGLVALMVRRSHIA